MASIYQTHERPLEVENKNLLKALKRKRVQYAIVMDSPGMLHGADYEAAFKARLIDGEWKTTRTRWTVRRFKNGNMPNEIWSICRNDILTHRRNKNMFCSPDDDTYSAAFGKEDISKIRQIGELTLRSVLHKIPKRHTHDADFKARHEAYRKRKNFI